MTSLRQITLVPAALVPLLLVLPGSGLAQQARAAAGATPATPASPSRPGALGNLGASPKEPLKVDADRLDVFEREGRAVFTGNVVAVQGESTLRCSVLTVTYETSRNAPGGAPSVAAASAGGGNIKHLDCKGPVTVTAKTQTATGESAVFDRTANKIVMTGNVALSDGSNITRGDRIVYDMNTGVANVETQGQGSRVRMLITPGSGEGGAPKPKPPAQRPGQGQF